MILFCVKTRSGEDEYENYGYYETFTPSCARGPTSGFAVLQAACGAS